MSEKWDFYFCLIEDQPASIFVNMGLVANAPITGFGEFGYVRIYMRSPRADGLSSNEEFEALRELEDAITSAIIGGCGARYVGRTTSDGARTLYFYAADGAAFDVVAKEAMVRFPDYEADIGHQDDPDWEVYRGFLYPSPSDHQRILNRHTVESLKEHDDNPNALRQIDHWAYFPDSSGADQYAAFVESEGFRLSHREQNEDGKYLVRCDRVDRPDQIDEVTLPLHERAVELGGEYDGWECPITK